MRDVPAELDFEIVGARNHSARVEIERCPAAARALF
jgi:hypothetical protein